jgi:hypothetical protein
VPAITLRFLNSSSLIVVEYISLGVKLLFNVMYLRLRVLSVEAQPYTAVDSVNRAWRDASNRADLAR